MSDTRDDWAREEAQRLGFKRGFKRGVEESAKLCEHDAVVHRENDETTWAALAEGLASQIRALLTVSEGDGNG